MKGAQQDDEAPTSMWAAPAFGERFSDFDATNTRAVLMFRAKS